MVAYPLAIPGLLGLRALLRSHAPVGSAIAASVGIVAIGAIVVLQALLVGERLTFEEQVGPASLAILALGASLVMTGYLGRASGVLPGRPADGPDRGDVHRLPDLGDLGRAAVSATPRRVLIRPMDRAAPGALGWLSSTRAVSVRIREE